MTIADWEAGNLTDLEALRSLCSDLAEIESELEPLEAEKKKIRATVERIITRLDGQKAEVKGFGSLAMSGGSVRTSYDTKMCDSLLAKLAANGYPQIAEELAAARKETVVVASLRITREKEGKR